MTIYERIKCYFCFELIELMLGRGREHLMWTELSLLSTDYNTNTAKKMCSIDKQKKKKELTKELLSNEIRNEQNQLNFIDALFA